MARKKKVETLVNLNIENQSDENSTKKFKRLMPNISEKFKLTDKQKELLDLINNNNIITIIGPAGTAKTFTSMYAALGLLRDNKVERVILTKPIKEAGESLGFLPGDVKDKIDPYYESYTSNILNFINMNNYKSLIEKGFIETKPLAYMRGTNFHDSVLVLDEAQNCTMKQLMLFITRMGRNSKIIISGDIRQHDIKRDDVALPFLIKNVLNNIDGIAHYEFTDDDIIRNSILIEITKKYEQLKDNGEIPKNF